MNVLYASIANRMVGMEHRVESLKHSELVDLLLLQEYQTEIKSLDLDLYSIYLGAHENRLMIPENIVFFSTFLARDAHSHPFDALPSPPFFLLVD